MEIKEGVSVNYTPKQEEDFLIFVGSRRSMLEIIEMIWTRVYSDEIENLGPYQTTDMNT